MLWLAGVLLLLLYTPVHAEVSCPTIFGDHMVLQRDRPILIWGKAHPGEKVIVQFAGQTKSGEATKAGEWRIVLDPLPASAEPRTLTVRGSNTLMFSDVLVGEVWLCSGQSNMEKPLGKQAGQKPTDNYEQEIREANHPQLRLFQMPQFGKPTSEVMALRWVPCSPTTVESTRFSAAGYFFGRELLRELGVPVGMIHSSFGGTMIEAWIPPEAFALEPALGDVAAARYPAWVEGVQASEL
jgi:sialate O-acetylesterase